jgi:hypothetical protein
MNGSKISQKIDKRYPLLGLSFVRQNNGSLFLKFVDHRCILFSERIQDEIDEKEIQKRYC